jgi:hypothetical protein
MLAQTVLTISKGVAGIQVLVAFEESVWARGERTEERG